MNWKTIILVIGTVIVCMSFLFFGCKKKEDVSSGSGDSYPFGTSVTISDDWSKGPFPIGFAFSFFDSTYHHFYVGANGWISFSPNPQSQGIRMPFRLPDSNSYIPKNCILGPFQDFLPNLVDSVTKDTNKIPVIFYKTVGTSPNRILVVTFYKTPFYYCVKRNATFQIDLFETSNNIENHIFNKPECNWYSNKATFGLQNLHGSIGVSVSGRNCTSWTVDSTNAEGWLYHPISADSFQVTAIFFKLY